MTGRSAKRYGKKGKIYLLIRSEGRNIIIATKSQCYLNKATRIDKEEQITFFFGGGLAAPTN